MSRTLHFGNNLSAGRNGGKMAALCCIGGWALPSQLSAKGLRDLLWSVLLPQAPTPLRLASGKGAMQHGEHRNANPNNAGHMSFDAPTLQEFLAGYEILVPLEDSEDYHLIAYRYYRSTGYFQMRNMTIGGLLMSKEAFTVEQATRFYLYVTPNITGQLS